MIFQATPGPRSLRRSLCCGAVVLCTALAGCRAAELTAGMGGGGHDALDSLPLFEPGGEPMRPAVDFVNSIGIVTHLRYNQSAYFTHFSDVIRPRILESGILHLREELGTNSSTVVDHYRDLADHGIDFSLLCDPRYITVEDALAAAKQIGRGVAFIEGPNEYDNRRTDLTWVPVVKDYVSRLHSVMRSDPTTRAVPILSPSFLKESTPALVGSLSALVDYGNIHPYPFPFAPTATKRVQRAIGIFGPMYGNKPFIATETGYHTGGPNSDQPVSEPVQAKYLMRLFLENFNVGVIRSYVYEFLDQGTDPDDREDHWGLLRNDGSPKPSFYGIRNLIALLNDGHRPDRLRSLNYSITSAADSIHHTLLQKADGTVLMVFWLEVSSTDIARQVAATITLASPVGLARVFRPFESMAAIATVTNSSRIDLTVFDAPVIVVLTP